MLSKKQKDSAAELEQIWFLRRTGRVEQARRLLVARFGPLAPYCENIETTYRDDPHQAELACQLSLFHISFLTRDGKLAQAEAALEQLAPTLIAVRSGVPSFHHLFQQASTAAVAGRYHQSLGFFRKALREARSTWQTFTCEINIIVCLENLHYPFEDRLDKFFEDLSPHIAEDWVEELLHEYFAIRIRSCLNDGRLEKLGNYIDPGMQIGPQSLYYILFYDALPYTETRVGSNAISSIQNRLLENDTAFQAGFMYRTLGGCLDVELDHYCSQPLCDRVERLYLWTWRWLCSGDAVVYNKILATLKSISADQASSLTGEDYYQLRNATNWLGLFAGYSYDSFANLLSLQRVVDTRSFASLEYEALLLEYCFAFRDGQPRSHLAKKIQIRSLPQALHKLQLIAAELTSADSFVRSNAVGGEKDDQVTYLLTNLRQFFREVDPGGFDIVVSPRASCLQVRGRDDLISDSIGRALVVLRGKSFVPLNEFFHSLFGLHYCADRHANKLAKLIHRVNKALTPFLRVYVRGQNVYVDQSGSIAFEHDCELSLFHRPNSHWDAFQSTMPAGGRTSLGEQRSILSRLEIQQCLGLSKSAALRKIRLWVDSGRVTPVDHGRDMRYLLHDRQIIERLAQD